MDAVKLEKAPWELVDKILEILHSDRPESIFAYNILKTHRCVKTKLAPNEDITVLTPGGKVDEYGTFLLLTRFDKCEMHFHSLHPDANRMMTLLDNCDHISWKEQVIFGPIAEKFHSAFEKLISYKNMKRLEFERASAYFCDRESGKDLSYTVPPDVYLAPVREEHAELINSLWPHRSDSSIRYVKKLINILGGIGLFLKENNELVAWSLHGFNGGPGLLQTVETQKRKGYATIIAIAMTKYHIRKGEYSVLFIVKNNTKSQQLFAKLPYKITTSVAWFVYAPI